MKLLKIPENVTELTSYLEFVQTIIEVNKKLLFNEFLKTVLTVSEKDLIFLNTLDDETSLFYDYYKNKFVHLIIDEKCKKQIELDIDDIKKIYPNESGLGMIIEFKASFKEHKWPTWLPTLELKSTKLTETFNK